MKDYSVEEILEAFITDFDLEESVRLIEEYIFYLNKVDRVTPSVYFMMIKMQDELYKCIMTKQRIDLLLEENLNKQKQDKIEEVKESQNKLQIHKEELNNLLDRYIEQHGRPSENILTNACSARDIIIERLNGERNFHS